MGKLKTILRKHSGRDSSGSVSVRHQGGRQKRYYRDVDFKRSKRDVWGKVVSIEADPNRNAYIALIHYDDGDKAYIISPLGMELGRKVIASENAPIDPGNALPLVKIPAGTQIHAIEVTPGAGGQLVRGAGSVAVVQGKEENYILVKLPSGEIRRFPPQSWASVGQIGNSEARSEHVGKAGIMRRRGIRPSVRGTAQNPHSHPHGGGEGRSGVGLKYPKTPWGKPAVGNTRRKRKYSDKLIVQRRKL
ncbi:50S ribosomal protein L2, partial [Candidatus Woesebacteria bacterium RIFCSPHIGHO2_12_FULL_38_9]